MQNREDKFLVINIKKREKEMYDSCRDAGERVYVQFVIKNLEEAIKKFVDEYKSVTGKELNQKYIVCNQDEPYAEDVWKIILNR